MLRNQSGIIKRPPVGTTPTTVPVAIAPSFRRLTDLRPRDPRISADGFSARAPYPRNTRTQVVAYRTIAFLIADFRRIVRLTAAVLIRGVPAAVTR